MAAHSSYSDEAFSTEFVEMNFRLFSKTNPKCQQASFLGLRNARFSAFKRILKNKYIYWRQISMKPELSLRYIFLNNIYVENRASFYVEQFFNNNQAIKANKHNFLKAKKNNCIFFKK